MQLPLAVVPLVMFTSSRRKMGPFVAPRWLSALAIATAAVIIALNVKLVSDFWAAGCRRQFRFTIDFSALEMLLSNAPGMRQRFQNPGGSL